MAHVTIPDTTPYIQYTVGSSSTTDFTIPFAYFADADIVVYVDSALQTITTDYTIAGTAVDEGYSGGTVTLTSGVTSVTVTVYRDVGVARTTDFPTNGPFNITQLNTELDTITAQIRQNETAATRAIHQPWSDTATDMELPIAATRASKYLAFDVNGDVAVTAGTTSDIIATAFMETLLDDPDAATGQTTLGLYVSSTFLDQSALFAKYGSGSSHYLDVPELGGVVDGTMVKVSAQQVYLNTAGNWDNATYATAANRAGKDFYVYLLKAGGILLSDNSSVPTGYTTTNSRKIAGFHCLCVDVGTISGHPLSGLTQGDILARSVWDEFNRPVSAPEGMVKTDTGLWVDIYLPSISGSNLVSVNGGTIIDGSSSTNYNWFNFVDRFGAVGKRLPWQSEFMLFALGSNEETNIAGSADPGTTGGHSDTAGQRMISNIGVEDCCGALRQWGLDGSADDHSGSSWVDADTSGSGSTYDGVNNINRGQHFEAPDRVTLGGYSGSGVKAGSRFSAYDLDPKSTLSSVSGRGVSRSIGNRLL